MKLPLRTVDIEKLVPHRYPFLLVDAVTEFVDNERIIGYKNCSANEAFFQGHFPGFPIMPGVLILEALAQLGAIYTRLTANSLPPEKIIVFSGCENVRFKKPVFPGDKLVLDLSECRRKFGHWKMTAKATVNGEVAVEATIMAAEVVPTEIKP
ncbi:3-hydroxyacyl-ACP dehydratase FabZ [bacterium]|nr:3-hydroxyacyl-ACP dehydratase FabZ [bacterium]